MPITRTPMVDDDGSGTTGTILNNAWKQELYNQIDALAAGDQVVDDVTADSLTVTGGSTLNALTVTPGASTLGALTAGATSCNALTVLGATTLAAPWMIGAAVTLPISANQNNWAPGGTGNIVWHINPSVANLHITGILAEATGTIHILVNVTGNVIILDNLNAGSAAANQIVCPGLANYTLGVWRSIWCFYRGSSWVLWAP